MKISKLLAVAFLSATLYSCSCEDVHLGKLEFNNNLTGFVPVQTDGSRSYYATFDNAKHRINYVTPYTVVNTIIPVRKKNYSGKFDLNSCTEYYTAEEREYTGLMEGSSQYSFKKIYRKYADKQRFNKINTRDKDNIEDIIEIVIGYNNPFPKPVMDNGKFYNNYITLRHFYFKNAVTTAIDNYSYKQEFLPTITLNGVEYKDVYHLYQTSTYSIYPEERFFNEQYPLDHVKGIYLKEGLGLIHAYTYKGKEVSITVE